MHTAFPSLQRPRRPAGQTKPPSHDVGEAVPCDTSRKGGAPAPQTILALDLASIIGFACGSPELLGEAVHGSFALPSDVNLGRQYAAFADWLADKITRHEPTELVIEAPFLGQSLRAGRKLFALTGIAELIAWRRDLRFSEHHASSVRKTFCGSGRADKDRVVAECRHRGFAPRDDNAADAIALLHHAAGQP